VVEEAGDVFPPQPKKLPSFNAPGDLGSCLFVLGMVSLDVLRNVALLDSVRCGGVGLLENIDKTAACFGACGAE
jgi:hypothetical protein